MTTTKPAANTPSGQAQAAYSAARDRVHAADLTCATQRVHKLVVLEQAVEALQNAATDRRFTMPLYALKTMFNEKTPGKDGKARTKIKHAMHQVARAHDLHRQGAWSVESFLKTPLRVLQQEYSQCAHKVLKHTAKEEKAAPAAQASAAPVADNAPAVRHSYIRGLTATCKVGG